MKHPKPKFVLPARTLWSEFVHEHLLPSYYTAAKHNVARADGLLHKQLVNTLRQLKGELVHDGGNHWFIKFADDTVLTSHEMSDIELKQLLRATGNQRRPMKVAA